MIARNHHDADACVQRVPDSFRHFGPRRIPKQHQPDKCQFIFPFTVTPGERQHAKTFDCVSLSLLFPVFPFDFGQATSLEKNFRGAFQITYGLSLFFDCDAHEFVGAVKSLETKSSMGASEIVKTYALITYITEKRK